MFWIYLINQYHTKSLEPKFFRSPLEFLDKEWKAYHELGGVFKFINPIVQSKFVLNHEYQKYFVYDEKMFSL